MADASQMSSMSSVSSVDSSVATPSAGDDGGKMNKIFIGLVVIAVILLVLILITGAMSAFSSEKDGSGDDGGSDDGKSDHGEYVAGGGGGDTTPATTKQYVHKTTREVITTSPTPDQFVPNPNPKLWPPPPSPGSQNDTLLCVIGENEITPVQKPKYPDDGLCNLTFFAHLVYLNNEFRGRRSASTWKNFKDAASQSTKTAFGFSIDYRDASTFYEAVFGSGNKKDEIKTFYDGKIRHYGFLQAEDTEDLLKNSADSSKGIGQLTALKDLATSWQATDTQIVIGVKFTSYDESTFAAKSSALQHIVSKIAANVLVLFTHATAMVSGEFPVCATSWTYIVARSSQPTLKDMGTDILSKAAIPDDVTVIISFTVGAHILKSDNVYHYAKGDFLASAFGWLPYEQMCIHDMPYDDLDQKAVVYISSLEDTFSYCAERTETIISKIKLWLQAIAPKNHGFAFYDLDLDDVNNVCKKGPFYRIAQVKQYLRT